MVDIRLPRPRTASTPGPATAGPHARIGRHSGTARRSRRAEPATRLGVFCAQILALAAGLVGSVVAAEATPGPTDERVAEVRIVGNQTVPSAEIRSQIRTRAGRPFDLDVVRSDVRKLATMGPFIDVTPLYESTPRGRVVIYRVVERRTLRWVKYLGNEKIKNKTLTKETTLKVGDAIDPYAVEEGRRKIEEYYRGHGFNQATVTVLEGDQSGDLGATFVISEGQRQRIRWVEFVGNTIVSDARLRTRVKSKPPIAWLFRGFVDRDQIDEDVDRVTAYYRDLGYFQAKVSRELLFNEKQNWLTLRFVIHEGPQYELRNVSFLGNQKFGEDALTTDLDLVAGKPFNKLQLDRDLAHLRDYYGSRGYVYADVQADPRFLEEPGKMDLVYQITEGQRFRVGQITVKIGGDNPHTRVQTVLNAMSLRPGDVLSMQQLHADERRLRARQIFEDGRAGGAGPKIVLGKPQLDAGDVARRAGPSAEPNVRGQSPDPGRPVRRRSERQPWQPGANRQRGPRADRAPSATGPVVSGQSPGGPLWSAPPLPPAQPAAATPYGGRAVGQLGPDTQFSRPLTVQSPPPQTVYQNAPGPGGSSVVSRGQPVTTAPPPVPPDDSFRLFPEGRFEPGVTPVLDPTLPLEVRVDEAQTGRFMVGVGVNSEAGVVGSIVLDERNFDIRRWPTSLRDFADGTAFRGAGQRFRLELLPGSEVQRYLVSFQEPYLWDTPVSFGLSGFYYDRRYLEWDEQRIGGRISLGYQLTPDLSGTVAYRGETVNVSEPQTPVPPEVLEVLGDNTLHGFRGALTHDTRDSPFLATEGHYFELGLEQVVGSFDYPQATIDLRQYFLLRQRADTSGRHVLGLSTRAGFSGSDTPVYDHFFAGGFSTLRGFDFRGASPRSPEGVIVGGEFMWINSVEYLFPITADDMLRGVAFCDFGTVERNVAIKDFRVAPGVGLRVTVPALGPAPISLDFAFPIAQAERDDTQVFSFTIGFQR